MSVDADGTDQAGFSAAEQFHFDVSGFVVRRAVFTDHEVATLRQHIEQVIFRQDELPPFERELPGGRSSFLIDHPRILEVVTALLGPEVRLETCEPLWRNAGESFYRGFHQASRFQADPIFGYRVERGRIFMATIRVVIELTSIEATDCPTGFILGTHKANFSLPEHYRTPGFQPLNDDLFVTYECPAGSAVFFAEGLAHTGLVWNKAEPRVAVLCMYSIPSVCYHRPPFSRDVLDALPVARQAFFRPVWWLDQESIPPVTNSVERFLSDPEPLLERGERTTSAPRLRRQTVRPRPDSSE